MNKTLDSQLAMNALEMAIRRRGTGPQILAESVEVGSVQGSRGCLQHADAPDLARLLRDNPIWLNH
jgi:hypothetical protein